MSRHHIATRLFFIAGIAAAQPKEVTNSIGMRLIQIPAGTFTMGFTGEPLATAIAVRPWRANGNFDEHPAHPVHITKAFYMGAFEVTNAQYEQFDPSHKALRGKQGFSKEDNEAVVFVNWVEANRFCQWLSKKEGKTYRLPTEAEWEYAARAGTTTKYAFGDTLNAKQAKFSAGKLGIGETAEVGSFPPNNWGLFDMHGNVWEWVEDCYAQNYTDAPTDGSARIFPACGSRVLRGGSWDYGPEDLRSSVRYRLPAYYRVNEIGFRVAREL